MILNYKRRTSDILLSILWMLILVMNTISLVMNILYDRSENMIIMYGVIVLLNGLVSYTYMRKHKVPYLGLHDGYIDLYLGVTRFKRSIMLDAATITYKDQTYHIKTLDSSRVVELKNIKDEDVENVKSYFVSRL